eukprot:1157891-Pelagomonas_calceolata.AAC.6
MRPEHAGVLKASRERVLHHPMVGRWTRVLQSQAKLGSIVLPHRDYLTPTTYRTRYIEQHWQRNGSNRRSGCGVCPIWLKICFGPGLPACT